MRGRQLVLAALGLVAVAYVGTIAYLPPSGLWTVDNASKYLQVEAFRTSGYHSSALPWAGRDLDPTLQCSPIPTPFAVVAGGQLHSIYSPFFALVSAPLFQAFGFRGLLLWPLVAALLMLLGLARLGELFGLSPRGQALAVVMAGLGTPVWFYGVNFWEHGVAASLLVWALVWVGRFAATGASSAIVAAGVLGGLSVCFRDELFLLLPVLLGAALWLRRQSPRPAVRPGILFVASAVVALVPLWLVNGYYTGSPFGFHLGEHVRTMGGAVGYLQTRVAIAHHLLTALHPSVPVALVLGVPLMALLVVCPRLAAARIRWAVPVVAAWSALPFAMGLWELAQGADPVQHLTATNSLFFGAPLIVVGAMRDASEDPRTLEQRLRTAIIRFVLVYAVLYAVAAPQVTNASGIHWGCRFLLVAYPLLALLAVATIVRWWELVRPTRQIGQLAVVLAGVLACSAQVYSIGLLSRTEALFVHLNDRVMASTAAVVTTDTWWVPMQLYRVFPARPVLLVEDSDCWRRLRPRLAERGTGEILDVRRAAGDEAASGTELISADGLSFYGVTLQTSRFDAAGQ